MSMKNSKPIMSPVEAIFVPVAAAALLCGAVLLVSFPKGDFRLFGNFAKVWPFAAVLLGLSLLCAFAYIAGLRKRMRVDKDGVGTQMGGMVIEFPWKDVRAVVHLRVITAEKETNLLLFITREEWRHIALQVAMTMSSNPDDEHIVLPWSEKLEETVEGYHPGVILHVINEKQLVSERNKGRTF